MADYLEPRQWKLRSESNDSEDSLGLVTSLSKKTGLSPVTVRVCLARGLDTVDLIDSFLNPKIENLTSPSKIKDMNVAVDRLVQARERREQVRVFGDYDVDGTAGAALLSWIFRDFGFNFDAKQPDRFKDGYGLNPSAVQEAHEAGVRILVTVDCGITSFAAAEKAKELGIELIIVDHHQIDPERGLPIALAVIDPQRADCESGLKQLCGCGLAFYLAMALRAKGRDAGWFNGVAEPNLKQHLDLVVMATAADMVPLTGDNHILAKHGLEILKFSKKPGVRALLQVAGLGAQFSPGQLGFAIGPRINASGRMQSASLALELLTTQDSGRATELARQLDQLNDERAQMQNGVWDQVRARVETGIAQGKFKHGVVVADPAWHEGVVGIVASRVTETFRRPAAVIAIRDGLGKGSVRSFAGKDVLAALRASSSDLIGFGGHKHAAGLSIHPDYLGKFADAFDQALSVLGEDAGARPLLLEGNCALEDFDLRTLQELERLGPFGPGNPETVFSFKAAVARHQILKGRHLKLNLSPLQSSSAGDSSKKSMSIEAIWFHVAERGKEHLGSVLDGESEWAGVPEINRFRGQMIPTLRVRDWRKLPLA